MNTELTTRMRDALSKRAATYEELQHINDQAEKAQANDAGAQRGAEDMGKYILPATAVGAGGLLAYSLYKNWQSKQKPQAAAGLAKAAGLPTFGDAAPWLAGIPLAVAGGALLKDHIDQTYKATGSQSDDERKKLEAEYAQLMAGQASPALEQHVQQAKTAAMSGEKVANAWDDYSNSALGVGGALALGTGALTGYLRYKDLKNKSGTDAQERAAQGVIDRTQMLSPPKNHVMLVRTPEEYDQAKQLNSDTINVIPVMVGNKAVSAKKTDKSNMAIGAGSATAGSIPFGGNNVELDDNQYAKVAQDIEFDGYLLGILTEAQSMRESAPKTASALEAAVVLCKQAACEGVGRAERFFTKQSVEAPAATDRDALLQKAVQTALQSSGYNPNDPALPGLVATLKAGKLDAVKTSLPDAAGLLEQSAKAYAANDVGTLQQNADSGFMSSAMNSVQGGSTAPISAWAGQVPGAEGQSQFGEAEDLRGKLTGMLKNPNWQRELAAKGPEAFGLTGMGNETAHDAIAAKMEKLRNSGGIISALAPSSESFEQQWKADPSAVVNGLDTKGEVSAGVEDMVRQKMLAHPGMNNATSSAALNGEGPLTEDKINNSLTAAERVGILGKLKGSIIPEGMQDSLADLGTTEFGRKLLSAAPGTGAGVFNPLNMSKGQFAGAGISGLLGMLTGHTGLGLLGAGASLFGPQLFQGFQNNWKAAPQQAPQYKPIGHDFANASAPTPAATTTQTASTGGNAGADATPKPLATTAPAKPPAPTT